MRGEGNLEELLFYCDSWLLQITTKPLEHLRSGCCMARVPLQHDLISCLGLDAGPWSESHILTIIPSDGIKKSVWLTKLNSEVPLESTYSILCVCVCFSVQAPVPELCMVLQDVYIFIVALWKWEISFICSPILFLMLLQ